MKSLNLKRSRYYLFMVFIIFVSPLSSSERAWEVQSPDEHLSIIVDVDEDISFIVKYEGIEVMDVSEIMMDVGVGLELGSKPVVLKGIVERLSEKISVQVPHKDAIVEGAFNQLILDFKSDYQLIFRVYNDGLAYRFLGLNPQTETVYREDMRLSFPENSSSFFPQEDSMYSHNERLYINKMVSEIGEGEFCSLPVMFNVGKAKILMTEASLHNYPGMFLGKSGKNSFDAQFPRYVLETEPASWDPDRNQIISKEADYIARIFGERAYPWRVFIVSDDDRVFVESNLVTQLSEKSKIPDADWIKPGLVAWDWYNSNNIYGVDFEAGLNQETYQYYVDFASENGIEYVILDVGWSKSTTEVLEGNENLDVPKLIKYAKTKNVGVILWILWKPLDESPDNILKRYSSWGAAGIKVDFMQRNDQYMVGSYENIARIAAGYKLLVNYHGAFKPAGIERVWPNVVNYEGVQGNEHNKWSSNVTPEHNVTIPFIRMAAGPLDFTPGSMVNMNRVDYETGGLNYAAFYTRPMSLGTRAHQVAMYVTYEAPLQMMSDSPTIYYKEQETVDFITEIPTIWHETIVLEGSVSNYIVVARRNGEDWYIGAMTDWTSRDFDLNMSFLSGGQFQMQFMRDGENAARNAQDYKVGFDEVTKDSKIKIKLSSGGGWVAILKRKDKKLSLN